MRLALRIDLIRRRAPCFAMCAALAFGAPTAQAAPAQSAKRMNSSINDISLDDQLLSRQHGGEAGMLMIAATPELMQNGDNEVTLWDEIAPPSPLPVPFDAARAAQGNVAT